MPYSESCVYNNSKTMREKEKKKYSHNSYQYQMNIRCKRFIIHPCTL